MKKIYLFCSAGMSTSLLSSNMQEVANKHKLDVEVKAFPLAKIQEIYEKEHPDCILLGPQVRFAYDDIKKTYNKLNTPVGVIDAADYGTINGEHVLKSAVKLIKEGVK
ncbi:MAG TPA: PTS sugar transporter subunit IIB [Clostridiaceae bacterium]|jgi:PTS system cellobiose-specific IIB component|nr:PTS sugar transporter subunit IIB [Clostridiaceae bacterium]HBF76797.1 PTS sugar transporter subunit IIB [Clostridiaceae bacterium]HBG39428.1 PTS sugar transporter subunit IIB [Clostridiaceae bacterium]HBN29143.1 PTS sugar transporter subunit IIB [Clostridiaceae bacterium]HBX49281.1 PTS sugar transporter subunit IIB [Clostridiaceae bacterium]